MSASTVWINGLATLTGNNPFTLIGGTGASWLRTPGTPGTVSLTAKCPRVATLTITLSHSPREQE